MAALCPKCQAHVGRANLADITVGNPLNKQWNGIAYTCPSCSTILSVAIDPIAIKTDIVNEILRALGKKL